LAIPGAARLRGQDGADRLAGHPEVGYFVAG
jgi:hypothetical protein